MNALSSTTSTVRRTPSTTDPAAPRPTLEDTISLLQRSHLDAAVIQKKMHAPPVIAADVLRNDRNPARLERLTSGGHIAIPDLNASGGNEVGEHARAPDELGPDTPHVGTEPRHVRQEQGDC